MKDKNDNKECGQQIDACNEYGIYQPKYINNHLECQWSKYTNKNTDCQRTNKYNPTIRCLQETHFKFKNT